MRSIYSVPTSADRRTTTHASKAPTTEKARSSSSQQNGQAVVEFLVAASFVLVPMLFLVTYLGKIGDAQHRAYEGARYGVWESARTGKSAVRIRHEIDHRILQHPYRAIDSVLDGAPSRTDQLALDPIYYHRADDGEYVPLLTSRQSSFNATSLADESPDAASYQGRVSTVRRKLAVIDVNNRGLMTANVEFSLQPTRWLDLANFRQRAWNTMVTDSWRAVTRDAVEDRLDSAILARSSFIDGPVLEMATEIAAMVGLQEWAGLEPGYIEHDVVPCSRVVGGTGDEDACL